MKKIIALSVVICMIFTMMLLVSCGNGKTDPKDTGTTEEVTTEAPKDPTPTPGDNEGENEGGDEGGNEGGNEGGTEGGAEGGTEEEMLSEAKDDQTDHIFKEPHPVY